jgi:hypothetical protein
MARNPEDFENGNADRRQILKALGLMATGAFVVNRVLAPAASRFQ